MRVLFLACVSAALLAGCAARFAGLPADTPVHTLTLRWQRLVVASDQTCPRCSSTEQEVAQAYSHLRTSLAPVGIRVTLETERIDEATFLQAPLESNRIWINERPLEDWLGAQAASSSCTGCCEGADCRTVSVGGATYEAIPAGLIVRAGFLAAGQVLREESSNPAAGVPVGTSGEHR